MSYKLDGNRVVVTKKMDESTPILMKKGAAGETVSVEVHVMHHGKRVLTLNIKDAIIANVSVGGGESATESVTFEGTVARDFPKESNEPEVGAPAKL